MVAKEKNILMRTLPIFMGIYRDLILIMEIQLHYQVYRDLCKFRHIHC